MVAPESNGKNHLKPFGPGETAPDHRPREVRQLKKRQIQIKSVLLNAVTFEEFFTIFRLVTDHTLDPEKHPLTDSQLKAATWILDRCIGKPTNMIEVTQADERNDEAPKVVLLDWRRKNDPAVESN